MTYYSYKTKNNATASMLGVISAGATSMICASGKGALFPSTFPYLLTLEAWTASVVTKREIVKCTNRSGDTFTIVRSAGTCPASDSASTQTTTAFSFDPTSETVTIKLKMTDEVVEDINTEVARQETAKLDKAGGQMTGLLQEAKSSNIASATTTNLATATGNEVHITGTTTITGLGTVTAGTAIDVIFDGVLTLTHNATSLILPNAGSNITTAVGDSARFVSEGSGNWKCVSYTPASGQSLVITSPESTKRSMTAGTTITAGDCVRMGVASVQEINFYPTAPYPTGVGLDYRVGYDASNEFFGQSFTMLAGPSGKKLLTITTLLKKVGTPAGNLTMKVYSNTGSTLVATSTNTIAESSLSTTDLTKVTFTFNGDALSNSTQYFYRIGDDRANSTSNYTLCVIADTSLATSQYSGGSIYVINSANSWSAEATRDSLFGVTIGFAEDVTRVYKTSAYYPELAEAIGFADSAGTAGNAMTIDTSGENDNQSGLTSGAKYYLSNTEGALSTTAGTYRVEAGTATATTKIKIDFYKDYRIPKKWRMYKDSADATVTTKYFHHLGRIPRLIQNEVIYATTNKANRGYYDDNGNVCNYNDGTAVGVSNAFSIGVFSTSAANQKGNITAVDADSFTVAWTKASTPTGAFFIDFTLE